MSGATVAMVGHVERETPDAVVIAAGGELHELEWGSLLLAEIGAAVLEVSTLVLVLVRDGRVIRLEAIGHGPEGGAVLEVPEDWPSPTVRPGLCPSCTEAGWVMEAPEAIRGTGCLGDVLVLPLPGSRA